MRRSLVLGGGALALGGAATAYAGRQEMGSMADYDASVDATRQAVAGQADMRHLIRYATLAPSGHNTQPWRFKVGLDRITIMPDFSRRTQVVDPDNHHLFVGLGAAGETLALAAAAAGRPGGLTFDLTEDGTVVFMMRSGPEVCSPLAEAILRRQSTRTEFDGKPVSREDLRQLAAAAVMPGVDLILITARSEIERVRDLVVAGNEAQMADAAFISELKHWLRFSPRHAKETGDGLFSAASGNPILPEWLGRRAFDWVFKVASENDKYARQLRSSPGIAVFVSRRPDAENWVRAGRTCQRFALQATALGLQHAFINQPVEVASLRPELATLVGMPALRPDIVMRFGHGPTLPFSARRPVQAVLA